MAAPLQPNEFRYVADDGRYAALWLLALAGVLVLAASISGFWGIASLAHANWLEVNDLPVGNYDFWGVAMLVLAMVQGGAALLLLVAPKVGITIAIALSTLNMLAQVSVISAYPVWSVAGILVNLMLITALLASKPREG